MRFKDLTGQTFGYLTVIERVYDPAYKRVHWRCMCKCGNETIVTGDSLTTGKTSSCGCKVYETKNQTHGLRHTRIYSIWCGMKKRCYNPAEKSYIRYGAKGITVCDEWVHDFMAFYKWSMDNGYTDKLTIDRIDNSKGYSPDNCRWLTHAEQQRNKNNNVYVDYGGKRITISELARMKGIPVGTMWSRKRSAINHKGFYTAEDLIHPQKHERIYTDKFYNYCQNRKGRRLVNMYSMDGTLLKTMYLKEVKKLGFSRTAVGNCLAGRVKSSGGYIWKYADE